MPKTVEAIVMVLESGFPITGGGGAESQVNTLGRYLARTGATVRVITPMVIYGPQVECEYVSGMRVDRIRYPKIRWLGSYILLIRLAWHLVRHRNAYSVMHAHIAGNMAAVCCLVGRIVRKPVIVKLTGLTEMVGGILDSRAGPVARLRRAAIRQATGYQATSSRIAAMLTARGFDLPKIHLIPNAVDVDRFHANGATREASSDRNARIGVFVGRLAPEKGLELLLIGWARALAQRPDAQLVLVGQGDLEQVLLQLTLQLGIEKNVVFAGPTSLVEKHLRQAHFSALPSSNEGLSNSLLEYMAASLPVVGTRVSGTEDFVVHGENGWLFEPNDLDGLVHCLTSALTLEGHRLRDMGVQAHRCVTERASIAVVAQRLLELYAASRAIVTPPAYGGRG